MNLFIWMLAGAILGWAGYAYLALSEGRGKMASIIIGAAGGVVGGKLVAPLFASASATAIAVPGAFSLSAMFFAAALAAVFLAIGNVVYNRWDV